MLVRSAEHLGRPELQGMSMTPQLAARIRTAAERLRSAGAQEVYLFGSAASNEATEPRDVDLAVAGLPPEVFFKAMGAARRALGMPLDLVDLDEDCPFTRYLREHGELRRVG
jgi:predicted nucleotidyltransferase